MELELVAYTRFNPAAFRKRYAWTPGIKDLDPDQLSEAAGRISYGSWKKPNPGTAENVDYLGNIISKGHESVFEHASATFLVTGVSRDMLLQLERHRHTSYSVRSQRFQDESEGQIVGETTDGDEADLFIKVEDVARDAYLELFRMYRARGMDVKPAREKARLVLPGGWETEFLVTANLRAWRYVISLRGNEHADREISRFAVGVAVILEQYAPNVMQDLEFYTIKDERFVRLNKETP